MKDGPWIKVGGDGSGSGVPSVGLWFKWRVLGCARMRVDVEKRTVLFI